MGRARSRQNCCLCPHRHPCFSHPCSQPDCRHPRPHLGLGYWGALPRKCLVSEVVFLTPCGWRRRPLPGPPAAALLLPQRLALLVGRACLKRLQAYPIRCSGPFCLLFRHVDAGPRGLLSSCSCFCSPAEAPAPPKQLAGPEEMMEPLGQCAAWLDAYFRKPAVLQELPVPALHHPLFQQGQ